MEHTKKCCRCDQIKVIYEFSRNRHERDGLRRACKLCEKVAKANGSSKINGNISYNGSKYSPEVAKYLEPKTGTPADRFHAKIIRDVKIRDLPQWFCWSCRQWHTSAVERADCPHCKRPLQQNGQSFVAWRFVAL